MFPTQQRRFPEAQSTPKAGLLGCHILTGYGILQKGFFLTPTTWSSNPQSLVLVLKDFGNERPDRSLEPPLYSLEPQQLRTLKLIHV